MMISNDEMKISTPNSSFSNVKFQPFSEHSTDSEEQDSVSSRTRSKLKTPTAKPAGSVTTAPSESFVEQSSYFDSEGSNSDSSGTLTSSINLIFEKSQNRL